MPSIDLTLSREIDAKTVTPASVKIFPVVQGVPELKNGNTISLKLSEKLKIGERYTLELTGDISSAYGVKMGKSKFFEFEATPGAKVTKVIPE